NSALLQPFARIEHRVVLDSRTDDVVPLTNQSGYSQIVSLSAAAGEHDLSRTATQQIRHRLPSAFDRSPRLLAMMMNGGRVPEMLAKVRPHCLQDFRQHGGRGVVVEINPLHMSIVFQR